MYWDHFILEHVEPSIECVCLGFVINYHGHVFITRRRQGDYLQECFEIPVGLMKRTGESLYDAAKRILAKDYKVDLISIDYFLNAFTYTSPNKKRTRQFNFSVTVKDISSLRIDRNDHGLWMRKEELTYWPIMTVYRTALLNFWKGEGYDPMVSWHLIEQAKHDNIWRHKVRLICLRENMVLLLKRSRRQATLPLLYEFPGAEIPSGMDIDSVIVECMQEQTGFPPEAIVGYVGFWDYMSYQTHDRVREFYYFVLPQKEQRVRISTHAYAFWTEDLSFKKVEVTPSVSEGIELLHKRFILGPSPEIDLPVPVYCDPNKSSGALKLREKMDAVHNLQEGKIDPQALKGQVICKKGLSKEILSQLEN